MAAADFTLRSVQVPASAYFALDASTGNPALYTAGAVQYWIYTPSDTALANFGWTGLPYRVVVYWGTGSSVLTGVGVNEGQQMTDDAGVFPRKLGFGSANDGSLKAPIQTWPTLCIFPQGPTTWQPTRSGAQQDGWFMLHDAILADVFAAYNCDRNFVYGTGVSTGATTLEYYVLGQSWWPTRYPIRYAAITTLAGAISGSGSRNAWPEAIPGENSTNQTFQRFGQRATRIMTLPWWSVHSVNDQQAVPAVYNAFLTPVNQFWPNAGNPIPAGGQSAGQLKYHGKYFRSLEYTGGSAPTHSGVFDLFYGNNVTSGALSPTDPWATWMFQQKLIRPPVRTAPNQVTSYAGDFTSIPRYHRLRAA